jgi:hypothetical protein
MIIIFCIAEHKAKSATWSCSHSVESGRTAWDYIPIHAVVWTVVSRVSGTRSEYAVSVNFVEGMGQE